MAARMHARVAALAAPVVCAALLAAQARGQQHAVPSDHAARLSADEALHRRSRRSRSRAASSATAATSCAGSST
jgi:hypothetical protein